MLQGLTEDTIAKVQAQILELGKSGQLKKATVDLATGITGYNLEAPAKLLVPLLSPFRQSISSKVIGGTSTNWKRITGVTPSGGFFPGEGTKANRINLAKDDKSATFRSFARLGDVTWEGEIAGRNFEDAKARAEALTLLQTMKEHELVIIGGNRTALVGGSSGVGPTVTCTANAGGSLADDQYFVRVKALTLEGIARASRINRPSAGNRFDFSVGIPTLDISVGATASGAEDSATTATTNNSVLCTWPATPGAVGYAIYVGLATGAANCKLVGIVTQTEIIIDNLPALTGADAQGADTSANAEAFDGIIPQLLAAGSGAYIRDLGAPLSAAVGHQIPELSAMIQDIYDRTKVEPDRLLMGWQEADRIDELLASVSNDRINIVYQGNVEGGPVFKKFNHISSPVTGKAIPIESNPNMPGGMILALLDGVPYQDSQIPAAWQMHYGSDFVRLDYALTSPLYEFEIRAFGALAGYAPALQGVIYDIHRY